MNVTPTSIWKHFVHSLPLTLMAMLVTAIGVLAATGTLDSPVEPENTSSYTLEDVYQRLEHGTEGTQNPFTEPAVAPGTGTMHTINDLMLAAPALDETNGATTAMVLAGKTFWGLTNGEWGLQTGNIPTQSDFTGSDGELTFAVPDGYYSGIQATAYDADLQAENILETADIFGVTGNIPTQTDFTGPDGDLTFAVPDGYYSGAQVTAFDADLQADNILDTVDIFGVTGNILTQNDFTGPNGVLTFAVPDGYYFGVQATAYDADLQAGNILNSVNIFGVTGSIPTRWNVTGPNGSIVFDIPDGYYQNRTARATDSDLVSKNIVKGINIFGVQGSYAGSCTCEGTMIGSRWCDNDDGTVTDMLGYNGNGVCLVWLKQADCLGAQPWVASSGVDAHTRVFQLEDGQCGLADGSRTGEWSLPTAGQMLGVTRGTDPVREYWMRAFTGIQDTDYWTSTATSITYATRIDMGSGLLGTSLRSTNHNLWAVRYGN